jgi:FixJ family two-component response regulator
VADPAPTVFIVDDDPLIRSVLEVLVGTSGRVAASFESAAAFLKSYDPSRAGCLICDICMPGLTGLDLQRELNRLGATLPVIFISAQGDIPTAVAAMRHGAFDFLLKPFANEELLQRVAAALQRDTDVRLSIQEIEQIRLRRARLTRREEDVLVRVVQGMSNKAISDDLSLSVRTVELHRAHVMEKMATNSLAQLVRMILEMERLSGSAPK